MSDDPFAPPRPAPSDDLDTSPPSSSDDPFAPPPRPVPSDAPDASPPPPSGDLDAPPAAADGPHRLHVAAAVSHALRGLRDAAIPLLLAIFAGGHGSSLSSLGIAALGIVATLALGIARWRTTTYTITPGALHFRSGLISPDDVVVPIDRIQAVDTIAGPVQRLFGVTGLHVQTPGGGDDGDVVLHALSAADAAHVRAALGHPDAGEAPEDRHPYRRLRAPALLLTALTAPQLTFVFPFVGALFGLLQDGNLAGSNEAAQVKNINSVGEAATIVVILLLAAWVISFAGAIVAFAGFEVERTEGRLRLRRGLLQRRSVSVPVGRIDGVQIVESPLRRPFGLVTLRLEVTSLGGRATAARTLYPLLARRDVPELLSTLLPEMAGSLAVADRPPKRARRRYVTKPLLAALAASAALIVLLPHAWPAAPVLIVLAIASGLDAYNIAGLRLVDAEPRILLQARRGGARVTLIARRRRLQELEMTRSPFQRRAGLATVSLEVARGTRLGVRHVERPLALHVLDDARAA
jgi:putative membrane protein